MNRFVSISIALAGLALNLCGQTNAPAAPARTAPPTQHFTEAAKTIPTHSPAESKPATNISDKVSISMAESKPASQSAPVSLSSTFDTGKLDAREIGLFERISREGLLKPGASSSEARFFQRSLGDESTGDKLRSLFRGENSHAAESSIGGAYDTIFPTGD